jgi:hypothetical protein
MDQKQLNRRNLLRVACFASAVILIVIVYLFGVLSPRGLGIAILTSAFLFFIVTIVGLQKDSKAYWHDKGWPEKSLDEATRNSRRKAIRAQVRLLAILQLALWFGLWAERAGLSWPILVGVVINLLFCAVLIQSILHLRRTLKLPEASNRSALSRDAG